MVAGPESDSEESTGGTRTANSNDRRERLVNATTDAADASERSGGEPA